MLKYDEFLEIKKLITDRKFDEALVRLKELYKLNPGNRFVEIEIAKIKARDPATINEAKEMFIRLLNEPKASNAMLELGKIEFEQGNIDKARSYFTKLISREEDPMAYIELAKLECTVRNYSTAKSILELVVYKDNDRKFLAQVELSQIERKFGNIDKALVYIENVLNSKDENSFEKMWARLELAKIKMSLGELENATLILNELLDSKIKSTVLTELIHLDIKNKNYESAYQKYNDLQKCSDYVEDNYFRQMCLFLEHKLGIPNLKFHEKETYFVRQLLNYDENLALKHIKLHLDKQKGKASHSIYSESIDVDELYYFAKEQILNIESTSYGISDKYTIRCNKVIGKTIENKLTDTLCVVTLSNTKDILTMYPIPAIDNELKLEESIVKTKQIKRESQIDKFNRRYGKK